MLRFDTCGYIYVKKGKMLYHSRKMISTNRNNGSMTREKCFSLIHVDIYMYIRKGKMKDHMKNALLQQKNDFY